MITIQNVLVPTDFGETADTALEYGRALARRFGARLHLLHVANDLQYLGFSEAYAEAVVKFQADIEEAAQKQLDERLAGGGGDGPPSVGALVTAVTPVQAIIEYANSHGVDLIVMGTHGRGPMARLVMGSVAERMVRLAPCPVLTVRHPGLESVRPEGSTASARS